MSKKTLIRTMAELNGSRMVDAERSIDATTAGLEAALREFGEVRISGFGTFKIVTKKARVIRHPQTGQTMTLPARKTVKFSPAAALDEGM